jgi:hypothetical protein
MNKYIFILLLTFQGLWAQVQFEAKVSKQTLGLNERLRIDFSMNDDGDNFSPPNFEGFKVIAGPSQQVSQSWINGRSSFNKTYSYFLLPARKGNLVIKQASIEINGQIYKTSPIRIKVTDAVEEPRDASDTQVSANETLHLVAEISKVNPYLNEPITVVYKLYFSYNIGITNWQELNKPKYNDFWSQNIDIKQLVAEEGRYNGEKYRFVTLRKTVLYPQKSGKLVIEPLSLDVDVQLPTNRRTVFGQMVLAEDHKRVSAGAKTINVKPLPESNKPADFSGAVGKFAFKVVPSRTTIKAGESLDLEVSVAGSGNLKLFTLPKPVVPSAFEMYDPEHKENVSTPLSGMTGKILDKYAIIPQFKGKYAIKPMSFTYFDLNTKSYKTITSPEIMVTVLDGPMEAVTSGTPNDTVADSNKKLVTSSEQFEFIKLKTELEPMDSKGFFGSTLFYILTLLPLLGIPLLILLKRRNDSMANDVTGNKIRLSNKLAKKYLSEAQKEIQNKEPFYIALEKALHNFLKAKLNLETSEMSKDKIRELLASKNVNSETVASFITLTENCEFARYAPTSSVAIQQDYDKAVAILSDLEKQIV